VHIVINEMHVIQRHSPDGNAVHSRTDCKLSVAEIPCFCFDGELHLVRVANCRGFTIAATKITQKLSLSRFCEDSLTFAADCSFQQNSAPAHKDCEMVEFPGIEINKNAAQIWLHNSNANFMNC